MPFAVTTPAGDVVRLDDIPLQDLHKICTDHGLDSWTKLLIEPLKQGAAAEALYRHCCDIAKDEPPEVLTPRVLVPAFEWVSDDLPDTYEGGAPKAEDVTETDGSSGAPSDTTGPQTSPEASPFESSNS